MVPTALHSKISPLTLTFLLFTIVVMFSIKGAAIVRMPMWCASRLNCFSISPLCLRSHFALSRRFGATYPVRDALVHGSLEQFRTGDRGCGCDVWNRQRRGVRGRDWTLIEVPVMIGLVDVSRWARREYFPTSQAAIEPNGSRGVKSA